MCCMNQKEDAMSEIGRRLVKIGGGHLEVETFEVPEPAPRGGPSARAP